MGVFTDREMQAKPGTHDKWLTASFMRGAGVFMGRITPSGERLFYFRYTDSQGRRPFFSLGPYHPRGQGGLTLADAYRRAQELSALYMSGVKDLHAHFNQMEIDRRQAAELERQRQAEAQRLQLEEAQAAESERARRVTVRQLFDRWKCTLKPMTRADGRKVGRKDSGQYVLEQFERHVFPRVGSKPLEDLRKPDLLALLEAQTSQGKARTANVLLADLKQMLDYGVEHELIATNPLAGVKKTRVGGPDVARERVLRTNEIEMLAKAVGFANLSKRTEAAIWLILATGLRVGECMGGVWADTLPTDPLKRASRMAELQAIGDADEVKVGVVDMETHTWYLPTTKNQRNHTIHLSDFALEHLRKLHNLREVLAGSADESVSPWVFPSRNNHRPVCVKSFGKQLADRQRAPEKRLLNRSRQTEALMLPGGRWTAHDLRRTMGTTMAELGYSADIINECLNHVTTDRMTKVYIRSRRESDQVRAFDELGRYLSKLLADAQGGQ